LKDLIPASVKETTLFQVEEISLLYPLETFQKNFDLWMNHYMEKHFSLPLLLQENIRITESEKNASRLNSDEDIDDPKEM